LTLPKYYCLLPGTEGRWWSGGTDTFLKLARLVGEHRETEVVVYATEERDHRSLDEALRDAPSREDIWLFTTGVDIPILIDRLAGRRALFYLQESGWQMKIPPGLPVICAARSGMAEVSRAAPASPVYLLPNALDPTAGNRGVTRDIDILHVTRKTTAYLRDELVPALLQQCRVEVVEHHLPHQALLELFNRSKVYLYDSSSSFADGVVEGFGLQPLEAIVCGCIVVTNLAGGMSDFLEPGVNCHKLRLILEEDLDLCLRAVRGESRLTTNGEELRRTYSEEGLRRRLGLLLAEIESLPLPRSETATQEINRHVSNARDEADQPLYSQIREQQRIIGSLQVELHAKVGERDTMIGNLQALLEKETAERDALIRSLQAELQVKVGERDEIIRSLQTELHAKVGERDAIIASLQAELAARAELPGGLARRIRARFSRQAK
jgi:hypothetical protein